MTCEGNDHPRDCIEKKKICSTLSVQLEGARIRTEYSDASFSTRRKPFVVSSQFVVSTIYESLSLLVNFANCEILSSTTRNT